VGRGLPRRRPGAAVGRHIYVAELETPPPLHPLRCAPSLRRVAPRRCSPPYRAALGGNTVDTASSSSPRVGAAAPCRVEDVTPRMDCCTTARRSGATQELHIRPVTTVPVTCSVFRLKGEKLAPEAPSPFLLPLTDPFLPTTRVDAMFAWV
jgi:hypothetical protein